MWTRKRIAAKCFLTVNGGPPLRLYQELLIVGSIMAVRTKIKMWSLKNRRGKQLYAHVMLGLRSSRALQRLVLLFSDTSPCPACGIGLVIIVCWWSL